MDGVSRIVPPMIGTPSNAHPAYDICNPMGTAPLLLVCDHATTIIPERYDGLGLDPAVLCRHVAWDIGAADVTRRLSSILDARAVLSRFSRLLIDPNRPPGHPTLVAEESDGIVVPGNRDLSRGEIDRRITEFHRPYHDAIEAQVADLGAGGPVPAVIAVHSFTPEMAGFQRPWHLGLLWNQDPRIRDGILDILRDDPTVVVGDNEPYTGRTHNYTVDRHGSDHGRPHISLEVRQDLIGTPSGADQWAARLGGILKQVIADPTLFTVRHYGG